MFHRNAAAALAMALALSAQAQTEPAAEPATVTTAPQSAPTAPGVAIELNKLEPADNACRAYFVIGNETPHGFQTLQLDLVMFDQEGIVAKRLAVDVAPLPAEKTQLKVFDIQGLACAQVGRILLNGVPACSDEQGPRNDCLRRLTVSARGTVPFIK